MIEYVKGTLTFIDMNYVVVETQGIGYQVICANPYHYQQYEGKEILIYTYQHVKEDILALYGFSSREERSLFTKLLNVSGLGPKGALSMLAGQVEMLISAIQNEDVNYLTKFPGIGRKTAQRVLLDLKDKIEDMAHVFLADTEGTPYQMDDQSQSSSSANGSQLPEAKQALLALGYSEKEVNEIIPELKKRGQEDWTTDQYLKTGLQLLMK